jgi:DNA invertase Pin-like site-specific DNA recombinase
VVLGALIGMVLDELKSIVAAYSYAIRIRTAEGRAQAKAKGVRMGRPAKLNQAQRSEVLECLRSGAECGELAARYQVSKPTIAQIERAAGPMQTIGPRT